MLRWPTRAIRAVAKLFEPLQDIDVYVEDRNDEVFYSLLFRSVCPTDMRVTRVFALGGRHAVVAAARSHDSTVRRAAFLIDGDFEWILGRQKPCLKSPIVRLDCYCIENLIISAKGVVSLLIEELVISDSDAETALDYSSWKAAVTPVLVELFAAFAVVHEVDPSYPTCSRGVGAIIENGPPVTIDLAKVERLRDDALKAAQAVCSAAQVRARYADICERAAKLAEPLDIVSGKDFVLPLLNFHLIKLGCRVRNSSLRAKLAIKGDPSRFSVVVEQLRNIARGEPVTPA